jgi:hypothetical protein
MYMTNEHDLARALDTAALHCRPGGLVVLAPDETKEIYKPYTDHGGYDGPDGRGIRYLEWSYDTNPDDSTYRMDFAYLVRQADGTVQTYHDTHILGLFSSQTWLNQMREAGFEPQILPDPYDRLLFWGRRIGDETPDMFG